MDDQFNTQMKKVQTALSKLTEIVDEMTKQGSTTKATPLQKMQLKYAAEDFKSLHDKA